VVNAQASCAEGQEYEYRASDKLRNVANGLPPLQHSLIFELKCAKQKEQPTQYSVRN